MFEIYEKLSNCNDVSKFDDDTLIAEAEDDEGLVLLLVKEVDGFGKKFIFDILAKQRKHGICERLITVEEGFCDLELERCTVKELKDYMYGLLRSVYKLCC